MFLRRKKVVPVWMVDARGSRPGLRIQFTLVQSIIITLLLLLLLLYVLRPQQTLLAGAGDDFHASPLLTSCVLLFICR